jgi:hypothetical protein
MKKTVLLIALALGDLLLPAGVASACPNCKEAMAEQKGDAARLKDGYYYSILLMMAMPFALLGTGAFFVVRAVKRGALPPM